MSQRHESKQRQCHVCNFYFVTTAAEIKGHAEKCGFRKTGDPVLPGYQTIPHKVLEEAKAVLSE